jgi:hypothetical protein
VVLIILIIPWAVIDNMLDNMLTITGTYLVEINFFVQIMETLI